MFDDFLALPRHHIGLDPCWVMYLSELEELVADFPAPNLSSSPQGRALLRLTAYVQLGMCEQAREFYSTEFGPEATTKRYVTVPEPPPVA